MFNGKPHQKIEEVKEEINEKGQKVHKKIIRYIPVS